MERPAYQSSVPAVARAVKALERLASTQQPLSLSTLARMLEVGPSSLLAILTTLRTAGLVSRSLRDGRYTPGPGLVALGNAAAQRLEPLQTFDALAADLVEQLGETVLLWVHQGDGLAGRCCRSLVLVRGCVALTAPRRVGRCRRLRMARARGARRGRFWPPS